MIEQFLSDNFWTIVLGGAGLWTLVFFMFGHHMGVLTERGRDSYRKAYRERTEVLKQQIKE